MTTKSQKLIVENISIVKIRHNQEDYISLTDMARYKSHRTGVVISNWLSTKYTIQFLGLWEKIHNQNFNVMEFNDIKNEAGTNGYIVSTGYWISKTNSIGIISQAGRYGGTFAHRDIAFEFASWLSPEFKLYLITEYQRLQAEENQRLALGWDVKRALTKINYRIHTEAIKNHLVPHLVTESQKKFVYASEADVLNVALFGQTAQQWKKASRDRKGNMRDYSDVRQLVVLANLESMNAELIRHGIAQPDRLQQLNQVAILQMKVLLKDDDVNKLDQPILQPQPSS